jgi:hypothetical protein
VASSAGSTEWRLKTHLSGFDHLYLAGAWTDTGFSTECIEAAVMSGMQASRAISGSPARVRGEHFLHQSLVSRLGEILALALEGALVVATIFQEVLAGMTVAELSSMRRRSRRVK